MSDKWGALVAINRTALKNYAPKARREFIAAITARAAKFGITKDESLPMQEQGEVVLIDGEAFPKKIGEQRKKLLARIRSHGFHQTMEEMAYTWFNRFLAIRFMELHGFLDHGYRVLSHPEGRDTPEILEHTEHLELSGLNKNKVIDLKLAGDKDEELYRLLLIAQCNALHRAMPFLFERINDETELLLPDNLLHTDSLIRKLVSEIDEKDWDEIEIVGWLYQFYISEKKDDVIGKMVKSEDIPAATQLFTPNWIVKYMVQNALGAQWMATYPDSALKADMEYYITPAEQSEEVQKQLAEITPKSLNPEEITLIDPAAGSGHILVEAYDLFKAIYLERGYRLRDIPRLILEKNLYGLDIDERAAQMAGFALLMRARGDDRRILSKPVKLNVREIVASEGMDAQELARYLLPKGRFELVPGEDFFPDTLAQPTLAAEVKSEVQEGTIESLINLFAEAKTFGSLITVPDNIIKALPALKELTQPEEGDDLYRREAKTAIAPLVAQAEILARKYDNVVANPPYMGGKGMNGLLKTFARNKFPDSKADLFAVFIERNLELASDHGSVAMITMQSWMFLSSYEKLRAKLLERETLSSMAHLGARAFDSIGGEVVSTTAFVINNTHLPTYKGGYLRLVDGNSEAEKQQAFKEAIANPDCGWFHRASAADFKKIPGSPIAYWVSQDVRSCFLDNKPLSKYAFSDGKNITGDNDKYQRFYWEVSSPSVGSDSNWAFISKGGGYKKWVIIKDITIKWSRTARLFYKKSPIGRIISDYIWFRPGITWGLITSSSPSFRLLSKHTTFSDVGLFFHDENHIANALTFLNSKVAHYFLKLLNPTLNYPMEVILKLPVSNILDVKRCTEILEAVTDISSRSILQTEISWDFTQLPLLHVDYHESSLPETYKTLRAAWQAQTLEMQRLEEENNHLFIDAYGLQDELTPNVPLKEITLTCNPHYRYGGDKSEDELEALLLTDSMKELISYAIGSMMGRYSLAEPGLIYAHAGNEGFDPSRYDDFTADDDGIVPITDREWFDDDATRRFEEFIKTAWPEEKLRENLACVADALAKNGASDPLATIRNYLSKKFYKDHLKTYKKRPIYWLFSSGKLKAFECLVYLHRYNEGTLSRMRMEYVTPLQSRMNARIDQLDGDIEAASSTPDKKRKQTEKDKLAKQLLELRNFDEQLRHHADQRITLDLDDGVKVNYGKFGQLLAEVTAICGKKKKAA